MNGLASFSPGANCDDFFMPPAELGLEDTPAGVLIRGGELPRLLGSHLRALVETKIVVPA